MQARRQKNPLAYSTSVTCPPRRVASIVTWDGKEPAGQRRLGTRARALSPRYPRQRSWWVGLGSGGNRSVPQGLGVRAQRRESMGGPVRSDSHESCRFGSSPAYPGKEPRCRSHVPLPRYLASGWHNVRVLMRLFPGGRRGTAVPAAVQTRMGSQTGSVRRPRRPGLSTALARGQPNTPGQPQHPPQLPAALPSLAGPPEKPSPHP